jgi:hypothetical protein
MLFRSIISLELVDAIESLPAPLVVLCSFCSSDRNNKAMRELPACVAEKSAGFPSLLLCQTYSEMVPDFNRQQWSILNTLPKIADCQKAAVGGAAGAEQRL